MLAIIQTKRKIIKKVVGSEWMTHFIFQTALFHQFCGVCLFISNINTRKRESHKSLHFATFFFPLRFNFFLLWNSRVTFLQIMYWAEEIKRAPHIFTLYSSIKKRSNVHIVHKAGGEKALKKYIVRNHTGREEQPVMNRHNDNDNWLTTLLPPLCKQSESILNTRTMLSEALFMRCLFASDTFFYTMFFYYLSKKLNLNELNRKP